MKRWKQKTHNCNLLILLYLTLIYISFGSRFLNSYRKWTFYMFKVKKNTGQHGVKISSKFVPQNDFLIRTNRRLLLLAIIWNFYLCLLCKWKYITNLWPFILAILPDACKEAQVTTRMHTSCYNSFHWDFFWMGNMGWRICFRYQSWSFWNGFNLSFLQRWPAYWTKRDLFKEHMRW